MSRQDNITYCREYYKKNRERLKEQSKQWYWNNKEYSLKKSKEWRKSHPGCRRKEHLKRRYNLSLQDYDNLLNKQQGKCAICFKHHSELKESLWVDHNHMTNKVRGLLCSKCNTKLGILEDKNFCLKGTLYLEKYL